MGGPWTVDVRTFEVSSERYVTRIWTDQCNMRKVMALLWISVVYLR